VLRGDENVAGWCLAECRLGRFRVGSIRKVPQSMHGLQKRVPSMPACASLSA
jgi:hypothetical protein